MNEPIRCRALISLVARYPSNQREMNSHCGVTETKMVAELEKETRGYQHKSFTFFIEGQSSISSHQTLPYLEFLILHVIEGEKLVYDARGQTSIQFIPNFIAKAINNVLYHCLRSKICHKEKCLLLTTYILCDFPEQDNIFMVHLTEKKTVVVCELRVDSPSSTMLTTTPSPVMLLYHTGIMFRSRPKTLYSPCAN